jgi:hypothetical protein
MKKFGLKKKSSFLKNTTDNRSYKIYLKYVGGISCLVCMGKCGFGPYRSNKFKKNCGRKPKYKDKRKSWARLSTEG